MADVETVEDFSSGESRGELVFMEGKPIFHSSNTVVVVYVRIHRYRIGGVDDTVGRERRELSEV
jgi:hypothetical protein